MNARIGGAALVAVALLAACNGRAPTPRPERVATPSAPAEAAGEIVRGQWTPLPQAPLLPREEALGIWAEGRLLVFGGIDGRPCPPNASCAGPSRHAWRDGAAYESATGAWTAMAEAPRPLEHAQAVTVDGLVYVLANGTDFLAYDPSTDRWEELPPAEPPWWRLLAVHDGAVIAYAPSHEWQGDNPPPDARYRAERGSWEALPADPLGPGFDRFMVGTDHGLVLLQAPLVDNPGADGQPSLWEAAVLEPGGRWRELPTSDIATGYAPWVWSGDRVVAAFTGTVNGGGEPPGDYGREVPLGGMLDLGTGAWEPLPPADPEPWHWPWQTMSAHGEDLVFRDGLLLDVPERRWIGVPSLPGLDRQGATAVWAGDRLVLWGGASFPEGRDGVLHADGWYWAPPAD